MTIIACCCNRGNSLNCCCGIALPTTLYLTMAVTGPCAACFNVVDRPLPIRPDVPNYAELRKCNSAEPLGPGYGYGNSRSGSFPPDILWGCVSEVQFGCGTQAGVSNSSIGFDTYHSGGGISGVDNFTLEMTILSCRPFHAIATGIYNGHSLTVNESDPLELRPSSLCGVPGESTFSAEIYE